MKYEEIYKDVTKALPEYVTAQCISNDCAMGAGVALAFRKAFPGLKEACQEYMKEPIWIDDPKIPKPYRHEDKEVGVVYNMFTKPRYWLKAGKGISYEEYINHLKVSLIHVKEMMKEHGENKLAMPLIGAGLDRCKWSDVKSVIHEVFEDTDINVLICHYEPEKSR
jgi:O-acetyl-ADP-ribose deacetylase (regulator of RNase III)